LMQIRSTKILLQDTLGFRVKQIKFSIYKIIVFK
jgi:hypothetical protein